MISRFQKKFNSLSLGFLSGFLMGIGVVSAKDLQVEKGDRVQSSIEESVAEFSKSRRWRMSTFTEWMSPPLAGHHTSVPGEKGQPILPSNAFHFAWVDYEIASQIKLVYFQRWNTYLATSEDRLTMRPVLRNPRFALRFYDRLAHHRVEATLDMYLQPGWASEGSQSGREFELGLRTQVFYQMPQTRWNLGWISELTTSYSSQRVIPGSSSNLYGFMIAAAQYRFNQWFSSQHTFVMNFQHLRHTTGFQWDYPMPLNMQHGVSFEVSRQISLAILMNHYLDTLPRWSNLWTSVWFSWTIL